MNWKEEAWEIFLSKKWDKRPKNKKFIEYTKDDLEPILEKYTKSGQGEVRIFHYDHEKLDPVKKREVMKVPISRTRWALVKRPPEIEFPEPKNKKEINKSHLTEGMMQGIKHTLNKRANPGETTLLSIANHVGIISDFYNLSNNGVMFTGGRQNAAGTKILVNGNEIDLSKAQIEIDGGFEWAKNVVIVEMKSSLNQKDFSSNQTLIPLLKWKGLLKNKIVFSMVLLSEIKNKELIYYAYNLVEDDSVSPFGMRINKSKRYIINL